MSDAPYCVGCERLLRANEQVRHDLDAATARATAAEAELAMLRAAVEKAAYVPIRDGLACRFCHAQDLGLWPRGRDAYDVRHKDSCLLATPPTGHGAALLAAARGMADVLESLIGTVAEETEVEIVEAIAAWREALGTSGGEEG